MSASTYSVAEAADLLGVHRETAYLQIAAGTFPVPAIRIGRRLRIPRARLDELLGLPTPQPSAPGAPGEPVEDLDATA